MLFSVYVCQCVINHCELNIICCVGVMDASVFKHIPHYAPLWFIGLLNFTISLNFCLLVACFLCAFIVLSLFPALPVRGVARPLFFFIYLTGRAQASWRDHCLCFQPHKTWSEITTWLNLLGF